jgi:hypothetical protein
MSDPQTKYLGELIWCERCKCFQRVEKKLGGTICAVCRSILKPEKETK